MIREPRSKDKLKKYYDDFIATGELNPNVHPWVAESWEKSRVSGVDPHTMPKYHKMSKEELAQRRKEHQPILDYMAGLYDELREHFNTYNMSLILLDDDSYVLEEYSMPFYQKSPGEVLGARLSEKDIGTSSISIALEHKVPFFMFGPEVWLSGQQNGDACSVPIFLNGHIWYILTASIVEKKDLPYSAVMALMITIKYALENYLKLSTDLTARNVILNSIPLAVYHIMPDGEIEYANKVGKSRLSEISPTGTAEGVKDLGEVVLNYQHTPLYKGFLGVPSYNKEVTWISQRKTYEDITTVVPLYIDKEVSSIVAVSLPIEDIRMMVAHAAGYKSRYHLSSLVGNSEIFVVMKEKAKKLAKTDHHILLQGESGTGKQRLAHGIHQESSRGAGPLIVVKCGDTPPELLESELFGTVDSRGESSPGKLELAHGGTLFLDKVEKMPTLLAVEIAKALSAGMVCRAGEDVMRPIGLRIIASSDIDLKRLMEKKMFPVQFFSMISKHVIRIPSLRSRKEDIPIIAEHIMAELSVQHHMSEKMLSSGAKDILMSYDWPGNTKQLQAVVEQAFFQTAGNLIEAQNIVLPGESQEFTAWKEDREAFLDAFKAAGGNISRLANMLDVSRVTLYRYLRKYGLEKG